MAHEITLYGFEYTRSARCRWTLLELGLEFEECSDRSLFGSDKLREIQPQGKLPAIVINGEALFESAAICTYLCDLAGNAKMLSPSGTRRRALHEQWISFAQSEIEGWLWSNAKHGGFYPEEKRVAAVIPHNNDEIRAGAKVLDELLGDQHYILGDDFSVTDIIIAWSINWARRMGQLEGFDNLGAYLGRLFEREHCALNPE